MKIKNIELWKARQVCQVVAMGHFPGPNKSGEFPKPIKVGPNSIAWRSDEVLGWIETRSGPNGRSHRRTMGFHHEPSWRTSTSAGPGGLPPLREPDWVFRSRCKGIPLLRLWRKGRQDRVHPAAIHVRFQKCHALVWPKTRKATGAEPGGIAFAKPAQKAKNLGPRQRT